MPGRPACGSMVASGAPATARDAAGRLRRRLRWQPLYRSRADRHRARQHRLRPADGAGGVSLARAARGTASDSRCSSTYRALHPDAEGLLAVLRPRRPRASWFFHAPVPPDTTRENFDFAGLIQQAAGFPFASEFDHVGFWDLRIAVAERYRAGPRLHRGRCRAQPSALWRLRPQQRA